MQIRAIPIFRILGCILLILMILRCQKTKIQPASAAEVVAQYEKLVRASYSQSLSDAKELQTEINGFLANPNDSTLNTAKEAWKKSRESYGQTEAYRFYEGPIDTAAGIDGKEGPEGRLNSWPLNEAFIDYTAKNPKSGIVQNPSLKLDRSALESQNQSSDEADVSLGYHAIEFLLWGQDLSDSGPGERKPTDFTAGNPTNERRRTYLKLATDILVDDLTWIKNEWAEDKYAGAFKKDANDSVAKIITGIATLAGFELASERIGVPLESGDQEDEHSCFSDNTHRDFVQNIRGIVNVYNGEGFGTSGPGIINLLSEKSPSEAKAIQEKLTKALSLAESVKAPVDQILKDEANPERKKLEEIKTILLEVGDELVAAGKANGFSSTIVR